jgi:hypothetical protein
LSKKIVRHSLSVVSKQRQAFLSARKSRRIALHDLTKARALLSRGFYDRKMGYPVSHYFSSGPVFVLLVFIDLRFRPIFRGFELSLTNVGHGFGSLRTPTPRQLLFYSFLHCTISFFRSPSSTSLIPEHISSKGKLICNNRSLFTSMSWSFSRSRLPSSSSSRPP